MSTKQQFTLTIPPGIRFDAVILAIQAVTLNAPAAANATERSAHRNGLSGQVSAADCRAAVEFLRVVASNELACIAGASAAVTGGSSVMFERSGL